MSSENSSTKFFAIQTVNAKLANTYKKVIPNMVSIKPTSMYNIYIGIAKTMGGAILVESRTRNILLFVLLFIDLEK